jgi:Domain of unknown function (DUF6265)
MGKSKHFWTFVACICVFVAASTCSAAERYHPFTADDLGLSRLGFLEGDWESINPKERFSESWHRTAAGALIGVRCHDNEEHKLPDYDLMVVAPTGRSGGCRLNLRQLDWEMNNLGQKESSVHGEYSLKTTNRASISFSDGIEHGFKMLTEYDSPDDATLDLNQTVTINGQNQTKVIHLKRMTSR